MTEFCIASAVIFLISEQNMSGIFTQSPANRRRYGVAIFVGIIAGIISAFVKWGAEHPFPPRSPIDFFAAACKVDVTGLSQDQILSVCSRAFLNPPHVFLRDYIDIDPTQAYLHLRIMHLTGLVSRILFSL